MLFFSSVFPFINNTDLLCEVGIIIWNEMVYDLNIMG